MSKTTERLARVELRLLRLENKDDPFLKHYETDVKFAPYKSAYYETIKALAEREGVTGDPHMSIPTCDHHRFNVARNADNDSIKKCKDCDRKWREEWVED